MHTPICVFILTPDLTPKALDLPIFSLYSPNFTKKPKKISSNSPRYVVELRQCSPISVLFRRKNTFLWKLTVPSPFADSGNPRKKRPAKSQTFYFVVQSIRFATQQAAGYLVSASAPVVAKQVPLALSNPRGIAR